MAYGLVQMSDCSIPAIAAELGKPLWMPPLHIRFASAVEALDQVLGERDNCRTFSRCSCLWLSPCQRVTLATEQCLEHSACACSCLRDVKGVPARGGAGISVCLTDEQALCPSISCRLCALHGNSSTPYMQTSTEPDRSHGPLLHICTCSEGPQAHSHQRVSAKSWCPQACLHFTPKSS